MKTISELNSMWWYRGLKVVYIFTLIFISLSVATAIYFGTAEFENTIISCDNGKEIIKHDSYFTDAEKYDIYRECSESDYWISQSKTIGKVLAEDKRSELDQIVIGMLNKGSSDKEVQAYVDNYKEMNGTEFNPAQYGAVKTEKGKSYTFEEVFGNIDTSNGFIKKISGSSILSNYKITLEQRFSLLAIIGFMILGIIATHLVFELSRRIFYYIVLGSIKPKK